MVTSRSTEGLVLIWTASVLVFSGRRDPQWEIPTETANALIGLWHQMKSADAIIDGPQLGYRGCTLSSGGQRHWHAYGGIVTSDNERKQDTERRFERSILESAPIGSIPSSLLGELRQR